MIFIGLRYAKKNNSSSDFFLGGRQIGPWMTALSAEALQKVAMFGEEAISGKFGDAMKNKFLANQNYRTISIISALVWGLGYFGMPHILVRFMGIRSNSEIKLSRRIATVWVVIALVAALVVGSLGTVYLTDVLNPSTAETVFSASMQKMFPAFIAGVFLCAILAAAMSTADSQLLVASSAVSQDIFKGLIKKDASEKTVLNVSRITVLVIAAIAFVLERNNTQRCYCRINLWWNYSNSLAQCLLNLTNTKH